MNYKKIIALTMSLLISASAFAPTTITYAENENTTTAEESADALLAEGEAVPFAVDTDQAATEDDGIMAIEDDLEEVVEETVKESGDYKYELTEDGNVRIVRYTGTESEIVIPDTLDGITVTELGGNAFSQTNLTKVTLPATITAIDESNPFCQLLLLEEIIVDENNKNYIVSDGVLYTKDMKTLVCYPMKKEGDSFTIPDSVETLGIASIYSTPLKKIIVNDNVKTLSRHCFSYNEKLESVDLSATSLEEIPPMAFADCVNLTEIKFSESTYTIDVGAFMNCSKLETVTLPSMLEYIGQSAFQGTAITEIIVPESVATIGYCALGYVDEETTKDDFTIVGTPYSEAHIYATDADTDYDYANDFEFIDIKNYERVKEYESFERKYVGDFEYTVIDGEAMLTRCISTNATVEVPAELDGYAVTSVYYGAFQTSTSKYIILPDTIKTIGETAFPADVETIKLPGNLVSIDGEEVFMDYQYLMEISVGEGDGNFSAQDGVLYNKDKTTLIAYPAMKLDTEFVIPESVKLIDKTAFNYNVNIESVELTAVEEIGEYAFEGCTKLAEVKLPKTLKTVRKNAFLGCSAMKSIRVPDSLEMIEEYCFGFDYDEELANDIQQNQEAYAQAGMTTIMPYSVMEGFKMYVEEDSLAYQYARDNGIEAVVNTVALGKKNVTREFVYVIFGGLGAILLAIIGIITGKCVKKKKAEKASAERKAKSAEKRAEKAKAEAEANEETTLSIENEEEKEKTDENK